MWLQPKSSRPGSARRSWSRHVIGLSGTGKVTTPGLRLSRDRLRKWSTSWSDGTGSWAKAALRSLSGHGRLGRGPNPSVRHSGRTARAPKKMAETIAPPDRMLRDRHFRGVLVAARAGIYRERLWIPRSRAHAAKLAQAA